MATRWNQSETGQFSDPGGNGGRKDKMPGSRHCGTLPPEVHYQVSKKIAQLTKVIFTLNARLDEQESMMEALKDAYEERLQQLLSDTKQRIAQYKAKANATTDLQHKITELESTITLERAAKEELVQALKTMREKRLHEQCCKSCGSNLTNGMYTKSISKEFDSSSVGAKTTLRNKEEEMEIIERILRKKSSVGKNDLQSKTNTKVKQMVDIPEKDGSKDTPNQRRSSSPEKSAQENGKIGDNLYEPKSDAEGKIINENGDSDNVQWVRKEREFQNKLSENQKEMQSLQNQIKNLTKTLNSTESDLRKLQLKTNTSKSVISTQTECQITESETQTETQSDESPDLTNKAKKVQTELKNTLDELQSISAALNETKTQIQNTHVELRRFSADGPSEMRQFVSTAQSSTVADDGSPNERTKFELKDKVSELLEQVTILMTNGGNMSDAEKENAELQKKLTEKEEAFRKQLAAKDNQIAALMKEKEGEIQRVESELMRQHNLAIEVALINHRRELENVVRMRDEKWASQKDAIQREHDAQLSKVQEEVNEMSRRLQSQTEIQTAELARLNHDLNEALNLLRQREDDALLLESKWRKDAQENQESFQEQLRQAQKQSDQFLKQLDQKRDEVLQVRREATQQIRNLENYWVEKVNQELNRLKRAFTEEKKKMLENFNKSQRLLRDKIMLLQSQNPNAEDQNNLDKDDDDEFVNPPSPITRKDVNRIRRDSVVSQIEFPTHENDLIDFTEAMEKTDERICASQPNVAQLPPQPRIINKKGKGSGEQRFIKRAESVFLPKLQFLSFWKSASSLDKAECQRHRDTCSSSPSFPKDVNPSEPSPPYHPQMTPELDPRKKQKMSPTFFKNRSGSEGFEAFSFQEARSSSCFNLSCKVGNPLFGSEGFSLLNKSKRNSVGSNNYLGVVPEAHIDDVEECTKTDELGTSKKDSKEPLLESEL